MKHLLLWQIPAVKNVLEPFLAEVQLPAYSLSAQLKVCCQMTAFFRGENTCTGGMVLLRGRNVCVCPSASSNAQAYMMLQVKGAFFMEIIRILLIVSVS